MRVLESRPDRILAHVAGHLIKTAISLMRFLPCASAKATATRGRRNMTLCSDT